MIYQGSHSVARFFESTQHLKRSWDRMFAYPVNTLDELGTELATWLAQELEPGETVRQVLVAPRQRYLNTRQVRTNWLISMFAWKNTPDHVLLLTDRRLFLVTFPPGGRDPYLTSIPIPAIFSLEIGKILLFSWFELAWAGDGQLKRNRVYFNTACEACFDQLQETLVNDLPGKAGQWVGSGGRNLAALAMLPYKFHVHTQSILLPHESIHAFFYRPAIRTKHFGGITRHIAPAVLLLLSDFHLLLIQDGQSEAGSNYGMITQWRSRCTVNPPVFRHEQNRSWAFLKFNQAEVTEELRLQIDQDAAARLEEMFARWLDMK